MIIIDVNSHLGSLPFREQGLDAATLVAQMNTHGITQAWVGAFEAVFGSDCRKANHDLLEQAKHYEDSLLPWAVINPASAEWELDLTNALGPGMRGVRLYPNYHGYKLTDRSVAKLLKEVAQGTRFGAPVAIYHTVVDESLDHCCEYLIWT